MNNKMNNPIKKVKGYYHVWKDKELAELNARREEISIKGPMDFFRYINSDRWAEEAAIHEISCERALRYSY